MATVSQWEALAISKILAKGLQEILAINLRNKDKTSRLEIQLVIAQIELAVVTRVPQLAK